VKFEVKDTAEIQHVTMVDEAETPEVTETPETTVSTSPKTGDETNFLFWFLLAGGSMMGLAGCFMMKKKR
jgi:LPXTG-motif cell wall-anchored protein